MNSLTLTKTVADWTFREIKTNEYTHGFHQYPARMHPEIAKRMIAKYAPKSKHVVFDPFMGSGGVLVEAKVHGNNSIGIDINPFAVLLSKVKTTPLDSKKLQTQFEKIISPSKKDFENNIHYDNAPKELDLDFWYQQDSVEKLQILKNHIFKIKNKDIKDFFKLCFTFTTRRVSFQKNSIYKIYRMKPENRDVFNPQTFDMFSKICATNIAKMTSFSESAKDVSAFTILGDTRKAPEHFASLPKEVLEGGKAHLVVTSPPYGDHGTTVAYGQFSKHPGLWLELPEQEKLLTVDSVGLGGKKKKTFDDLKSPLLDKTLKIIGKKDKEVEKKTNLSDRKGDVYSFFFDLDECFENISQVLKPGKSHCCFVVANRKVRRTTVPMDEIIIELAKKYGFRYKETLHRTIANKAMATRNTPENITDYPDSTMNEESIVVWEY